ncbi:MAG: AMP-binding protein [Pyrinomonadaceae bacterium]
MRETINSFLEDYRGRDDEPAFAHRRGLRVYSWSYARVATAAFQFARELEERGIEKGDRVLLRGENSPEWVAAFFGCALRGVIVVPLDAESAPEFVASVQQQVEAKLLLHSGEARHESGLSLPRMKLEELSEEVARHSPAPYQSGVEISENEIVEIIYTSGTTAEPRGVVLTHRNLLANLSPLEEEMRKYLKWERLVHPLRFLHLVPLSHVFGQFMGIFVPQLLGGFVFFQDSLNPSEVIRRARGQRVSVIVAVPRLLETLRDKIERDWAARGASARLQNALAAAGRRHYLRRWWTFREVHRQFGLKFWAFVAGGATLPAETEEFWRRLGFAVLQGYGMTETASLVSVNHPFKQSRGSIGKGLPSQEIKLDETGEIMVRGENVSPGYWRDGSRSIRNDDGWLRTGDIGEMDADGNLFFRGRKKDVIVTAAGLNIYPEDLEAALNRQPEIRDSVVVPFEATRGPEPLAVLILRHEHADADAAVRRANEMLAQHQQVRRWLIWPESDFPRTATQKVRKREVASKMSAEGERMAGHDEAKAHNFVLHPSAIVPDFRRLDPAMNLATDLKLDSLGRVELLSALEDRYQVDIDEAAFTAATTVGDVERMINEGTQDSASRYPDTRWAQRFPVTWMRNILFYLFTLPLTWLMCPARVRGSEHLEELQAPVVFVSNHITMADHALILSALPRRFTRRMAIAMEGEILRDFRYPSEALSLLARARLICQYALIVTLFNVFPLPKRSGFRRSFAFAGEAMDSGHSILVFPEGKRSDDGRMNPFMTGAGLLVADLHAPVVPVRIEGLYELKRQRRYFARPGEVSVIFGEPVSFAEEAEPARIANELEKRVAALR